MSRIAIHSDKAPKAIGPYSQAVRMGDLVFLTGQIPLDPVSMQLVKGFEAEVQQVMKNLKAVAESAGGSFEDVGKLTVYLTDLTQFNVVNEVMSRYFNAPYPARASIGVASLALGASIAIDAIMVIRSAG